MPAQPIQFGDEGQVATADLLRSLEDLAAVQPGLEQGSLPRYLRTLHSLDRQYGGSGRLPVEDAEELVAATLTELTHLGNDFGQRTEAGRVAELILGVALWAIRHEVAIAPVEPVANALAMRSNAARDKPDLAAVFGLMQGVIEHVRPRLAADLERSNPERPWRILHVNFAITAIRTEDPQLIDHAFDALEAALPGEAAGFYAEAMALALAPGIAPEVRGRIEARHRRHNPL